MRYSVCEDCRKCIFSFPECGVTVDDIDGLSCRCCNDGSEVEENEE